MRDIGLVVYSNDDAEEIFVTTTFYEEKFKNETFGDPESDRNIEDYTRSLSFNKVKIEIEGPKCVGCGAAPHESNGCDR
jgi:hypothetical protein